MSWSNLFINDQKVTTQGKIGTFTVGAGEIPSLEITIKAVNKTWSKIKILKLNKDGSAGLPGAKFQISNNADFSTENGGIVIKDLVTDANGEINVPNILKVGEKWWAQETEAPAGYLLDSTSKYRVLEEGVNTFTFNNSLGGWIKIIKIDELTKLPLNGAVFELATNQGFTENYFTMTVNGDGPEDNNGEETTGLLKPGLWYVREKTAPSGYIKDNDIEPVNVVEGQITRVNFSNTPVGQIVVTKALDGNYSDPDTEFKITVTCGNPVYSRFQMVKGGKSVTFDSLPYGEYTVTETDPGTLGYKLLGYAVNGTTYNTASAKVRVGENNGANNTPTLLSTIASVIERSPWDQQVTVTNQKIAKLTLEKVFLNDWTNTEDEFTFTVTKVGGTPKTYKVKSGSPVELIGLDYGQYTIQETGMPEGYAFSKMYVNNVPTNDNPVTVTVGANNLDVKVKAENDKQIKLTVKKFDAWNPQKPLAGMHFVIADNDKFEKLPGGIYIEDETNDKGEFTTSQYFPYGTKLWVKETVPPTDYLIDPNPQSITLTYTENVVTFKDPPVNHCWIKIFKLDADTQKPLNGARFEVANNADFKDSFFMDITANGEATTNDLTPGDWWVREDKAPAGYIKDTSVQKITVAWHETKPVTFTNRHGGFVI